jgi:GntR family transcriptional regulator of vanillate catabolism
MYGIVPGYFHPVMINQKVSKSQQDRVLVQLRDLILKGEFGAGERLAEIQLAEKLGASRTPVKLALAALEKEGLVEQSQGGGYLMRHFSESEIFDAISVRGNLEGMAARLVAEHGMPRQLLLDFQHCLAEGDRVLKKQDGLNYDDYAGYIKMNDRFHALLLKGANNTALARAIEVNNHLPFAPASAMLPMQSSLEEGVDWLHIAHRQHHNLVYAMEHGQGTRAQALAEEHVEIAKMNFNYALQTPEQSATIMPAIKLIIEN